MQEQTFITQEGLDRLNKELKHLKTTKRKEIARRIQEAKELGDLSENAEYADAKTEQAFTEGRVQEIEMIVRNAKIIEKNNDSTIVRVGSRVLVKDQADEKEFTIVGSNEADPIHGLISNESPMGKAFIGKKRGDRVAIEAPKGLINFEIVEIN